MEGKSFYRLLVGGGVNLFFFLFFSFACFAQDFSEDELDRKLNVLEERLSSGREETGKLQDQIDELQKNNQDLSDQLQKKEKTIKQLQSEMIAYGDRDQPSQGQEAQLSSSQRQKVVSALEKAQEKMRQLKDLNLALYGKLKEKESLLVQLQQDQPDKYASLKDKVEQLKDDILNRDKEIKSLRRDLADQKKQYQRDLAGQIKEKDARIAILEQGQQGDSEALRKELAKKEQQIVSLREDFEGQKKKYEQLLAKAGSGPVDKPAESNAEMVKLKRALAEKEKEIETMIVKQDKESRQVGESIAHYQKRIEEQDKEIARLTKENKAISSRPASASGGKALAGNERELSRLREQNRALSAQVEEARQYKQMLEEKQDELARLQKENRSLAAKVERVSVSIDGVATDAEVSELSRQLKMKTELLDNLKNNYFQSSQQDRQKIDMLERQVAELKSSRQAAVASTPQIQPQFEGMMQKDRELETALQFSKQQVKMLEQEIAEKEAMLNSLRYSSRSAAGLNETSSRLQNELRDSKNTLFKLQSLLQDKDAEIQALRATMERVLTYMDALGEETGLAR